MIDWLRRVLRFSSPTVGRKLPTDSEHKAVLSKADRVIERLEDYRRMDGVLVITRKTR